MFAKVSDFTSVTGFPFILFFSGLSSFYKECPMTIFLDAEMCHLLIC
jgi:hypothetical protein